MLEIGQKAQVRGLTPEILKSILSESRISFLLLSRQWRTIAPGVHHF
jgi:hypothetical protein